MLTEAQLFLEHEVRHDGSHTSSHAVFLWLPLYGLDSFTRRVQVHLMRQPNVISFC